MTDPKEVASVLSNFVNGARDKDIRELADLICRDHRTLQQMQFKAFVACITIWANAYDAGRYDLRNEVTCKLAKSIVSAVPNLDAIPLI